MYTIKVMDDILMEIYNIRDIVEIGINDLIPNSAGENIEILPNLYIRYGNGKYLSLCSRDKYFDIYVKKVYEVYLKEKRLVVKDETYDPFGFHTEIKIDDRTKRILESGDLIHLEEIYKLYDTNKSYDENSVFQKDEFKFLLSLISYHLKLFLDKSNRTIIFNNPAVNGYRNNYMVECMVDGLFVTLLINYKKIDDNSYDIEFYGINKTLENIKMNIIFGKNGIKVIIKDEKLDLIENASYDISDMGLRIIDTLNHGGKTVSYKDYYSEKCINNYLNITSLDDQTIYKWYKLPWNSLYGIHNEYIDINETESIIENHNKYFGITDDMFIIKEYYSKTYHRHKTLVAKEVDVILEEVKKNIYGIPLDNEIYLIETSFQDDLNMSGYYDTYLKNKYYYHLIRGSISNIDSNNLVSISREEGIFNKADFLNKNLIRKLIKESDK